MSNRNSVVASVIGLWARDFRVLRRDWVPTTLRTIMNPLLTVFVFTYVLPRTGQRLPTAAGSINLATVLVPGLVAVAMIFTSIAAVALPLSIELGATREIEDRVLAPIPLATVPLAKVAFGAFQGALAGAVIFPIITLLPATAVHIRVASWGMLVLMLLLSSWTAASLGLFLGTAVRPQHIGLMFAVILTPIMFLGCVYYPWASLSSIRWLQVLVLGESAGLHERRLAHRAHARRAAPLRRRRGRHAGVARHSAHDGRRSRLPQAGRGVDERRLGAVGTDQGVPMKSAPNVKTAAEYVASLPPDRRKTITAVRKMIRDNIPSGYSENILMGMICLGRSAVALSQYLQQAAALLRGACVAEELLLVVSHGRAMETPASSPSSSGHSPTPARSSTWESPACISCRRTTCRSLRSGN